MNVNGSISIYSQSLGGGVNAQANQVGGNIETSGSAQWGMIGGNIGDQTDLQNALSGKQNKIDNSHKLPFLYVDGLSAVASSGNYNDLLNTPTFAEVATSGDYDDLTNKPSLSAVATSGDYNDLIDKPALASVATSGNYNDLSNRPTYATVATTGDYDDLVNTPSFAAVATTGDYDDLSNKPSLSAVATSGSYNDLSDKPTFVSSVDSKTGDVDTGACLWIGTGTNWSTVVGNCVLRPQYFANWIDAGVIKDGDIVYSTTTKNYHKVANCHYDAQFGHYVCDPAYIRTESSGGSVTSVTGGQGLTGGTITTTGTLAVDSSYIVDLIYPVGAIYISVVSTSPQTLFGGTWEQIKDTFLLSAGDVYNAGSTGGEAEHTLTINEMPSHNHNFGTRAKGLSSGSTYARLDSSFTDPSTDLVANTGGGQAHNNMPPYLTVYMWKRTA